MLHPFMALNEVAMAKGSSGRIVIEMDPALKRQLYSVLDKDGSTLKNWFIERAENYVSESVQPRLAFADDLEKELTK